MKNLDTVLQITNYSLKKIMKSFPKIEVTATRVETTRKHPASDIKDTEKHELKVFDYRDRCSFGNYIEYTADCGIFTTLSGIIFMGKQAPYWKRDFLTLPKIPISMEIVWNNKKYNFSLDDTLNDILTKLWIGDCWNIQPSWGIERIKDNVKQDFHHIQIKENFTQDLMCWVLKRKSSFSNLWDINPNERVSLKIKKFVNFLKTNFYWIDVNFKVDTKDWEKYISLNDQIWEFTPSARWDFKEMWEEGKQRDVQIIQTEFIENNKPRKWCILAAWHNWTRVRADWSPNTWRDGWANWQSLDAHHTHCSEIEIWEEKVKLSPEQEENYHDRYVSELLCKYKFDWWDIDFETLEPLDNTKNDLTRQWISFRVKKWSLRTEKFWEEYDLIVKLIEDLDISKIDIKEDIIKGWYIPKKTKNILKKIKYKEPKLSKIIENNKELFIWLIEWMLRREVEYRVWLYSRRYKWIDEEKSRVIPFPNLWYTIALEKDDKWEVTLRIAPRIHSKGALVELVWQDLQRVPTDDEELNPIVAERKMLSSEIIKEIIEKGELNVTEGARLD